MSSPVWCAVCSSTRPMHVAALAFLAPLASKHQTLPEQQKLGSARAGRPAAGWFVRPHSSSSTAAGTDQRSSSRSGLPSWWSSDTSWLYPHARQLHLSTPRYVMLISVVCVAVLVYRWKQSRRWLMKFMNSCAGTQPAAPDS